MPWSPPKDHGEQTAREIDEEVRRILQGARERARAVLTEQLDREVTEGEELKRLLDE
ncbi:MAG TPA: hypothetical protein VES58_04720 [Syntrophobacteria bacterium]|nr:hypothetical protein [Syntrophobacteria bacterium]